MPDAARVLVIAEAGVNHNGSLDMACRLALAARDAGADVVKYQTFTPSQLVTRSAGTAEYQKEKGYKSQLDMLAGLQLGEAQHRDLKAYCDQIDIRFLSTPFDMDSFRLLREIGQRTWKIPSGEITNYPLIAAIGAEAGEVILSTGMSTMGEIERALAWLEEAGCPRDKITVLHCTTEYPAPIEEVNLRAMRTIAEAFHLKVGYSDHTTGIEIPIAAAALGASVIEKHFTLDRSLPGPDQKASLEPDELSQMIKAIRNVASALGSGIKSVTSRERKNITVARKSIVASRPIRAGERFDEANVTTKRPGTGISACYWRETIGRTARRDYEEDEPIEW